MVHLPYLRHYNSRTRGDWRRSIWWQQVKAAESHWSLQGKKCYAQRWQDSCWTKGNIISWLHHQLGRNHSWYHTSPPPKFMRFWKWPDQVMMLVYVDSVEWCNIWLVFFYSGLFMTLESLRKHIRKNTEFVWSPECEQSFQEVKQKQTSAPILIYYDGWPCSTSG